MTRLRTLSLAGVLLLAGGSLLAQGNLLSGTWNMNVKGPAAHGDLAATMVLSQKEEKVTGTLSAHGNEHTLAGSFKDGTLKLDTTGTPADTSLSLTATRHEDGTLSGYLSGPMGDLKWTASRVKDAR